jgi:hypothetical protein
MPFRSLFIIRTALMTGVFLFAAVAFFGPRFGVMPQADLNPMIGQLRYALWGAMAVAMVAALLLRSRVESVRPEKQGALLIIGWALGEMAALFGSAMYMAGGGSTLLSLGLMTFVFTLVILPIPRPRR